MLSGCEADLARKATNPATVSKHRDNSLKWLHKVYGTNVPTSASGSDLDTKQLCSVSPPRANVPIDDSGAGDLSVLSAPSIAMGSETTPKHQRLFNLASEGLNISEQQSFRRELQPLRDQNADQGVPYQVSDAKRKPESKPFQGHSRRRRLVNHPKVQDRAPDGFLRCRKANLDEGMEGVAARRKGE
jgi:hypothetical protein